MILKRITQYAHQFISSVLEPGDYAVDATCGNGHDTLFMARHVGEDGCVFAFDIQKEALANAEELIRKEGYTNQVVFINDSHANLGKWIPGQVKGIMFNLGYLPGGDKGITTQVTSTIKAIEASLQRLTVGGLMTICVYRGHSQGKVEAEQIDQLFRTIDAKEYKVLKLDYLNQQNDPPYLLVIERR